MVKMTSKLKQRQREIGKPETLMPNKLHPIAKAEMLIRKPWRKCSSSSTRHHFQVLVQPRAVQVGTGKQITWIGRCITSSVLVT